MLHARILFCSKWNYIEQMKHLGTGIISLDMSSLRLGDYSIDKLKELISLIPASVSYLNLGTNRLYRLNGSDLSGFFTDIAQKTNVRYVSLHHNELGSVRSEILMPALTILIDRIVALDLGYNELWRKTSDIWKCLFSRRASQKLSYLNLSGNLMLTQESELVPKLSSISPLSLRQLSLALNQIGEKKSEELRQLFTTLSPQTEILDLQKNSLHYLSQVTMQALHGTLKYIKTLYVSSGEINRMSYEQLDEFARMVPACHAVIAVTRINRVATSEKIKYLQSKLFLGKSITMPTVHNSVLIDANRHDPALFLEEMFAMEILKRSSGLGTFLNKWRPGVDSNHNKDYAQSPYVRAGC